MGYSKLFLLLIFILVNVVLGCKSETPVERKKSASTIIVKTRPALLSREQRKELSFPDELIAQVELAAGADAEPFFSVAVVPSENMKGEKGFERERLAGFSVHTKRTDEIITSLRAPLRARGYLLFKSHKGYGKLPDIVTVIKGNNSYDILKMQGTEAPNYHLDTKAIIAWLKERQKDASFVVTGAGPDWLEARFTKAPANMTYFARKIVAFSPEVLEHGPKTVDKVAERMKRTNDFYLVWD